MKRRLISWMLVLCMLVPFCFTAYAVESNTDSLESVVTERVEQIVLAYCSGRFSQYNIGNATTIYNADTSNLYYVIPIFSNQECVGMVEVGADGNVTLTSETALYTNIAELSSPDYLLYISGGIVYAEYPNRIVELYDSGFDIAVNNNFALLPYIDKITLVEDNIESIAPNFDIDTAIEEVEMSSTLSPGVSLYGVVPVTEGRNCSITNFVEQNGYNICWAACVATIVNYKKGLSLTAESVATNMGQNYTASNYHGAPVNVTLEAFSSYSLNYESTQDKLSWQNVKNSINNDYPFAIRLRSSSANSGHIVTGYGYECRYGDDYMYADWRYVSVWDSNGYQWLFPYHSSSYNLYGYDWEWIDTLKY